MEQNEQHFEASVTSLTIHPAHRDLPQWDDDDPEFDAFCRDIHKRGIQDRLKVDSKGRVADGRQRLRAAKRLKLETVPCTRIPDREVQTVILQSLLQRRHYTKGGRAYTVALFLKEDHEGRHKSYDLLAEESGISTTLLKQAFQVLEVFASGESGQAFRAEQEPKILSGDSGLGAVLAGWAGRQATIGKQRSTVTALEMWKRSFSDLSKRFSTWEKFDDDAKATASAHIATAVEKMPADLLALLNKKIIAEKKRRETDEAGK